MIPVIKFTLYVVYVVNISNPECHPHIIYTCMFHIIFSVINFPKSHKCSVSALKKRCVREIGIFYTLHHRDTPL
jgi:hypothetical protein